MKSLIVSAVFFGNLLVTSYRSTPGQTDSSPFYTSIGEHTSISGVAVSQDILCPACRRLHKRCAHPELQTIKGQMVIHYGDALYIEGTGQRIVNDCMGRYQHYHVKTKHGMKVIQTKQRMWLDIWLPKYQDEHHFHVTQGINKHRVWKIIGEIK